MEDVLELMDLPTEILCEISLHLLVDSRLAFRATCKYALELVLGSVYPHMDNLIEVVSTKCASILMTVHFGIISIHELQFVQRIGLLTIEPISVKGCEYTHHMTVNRTPSTRSSKQRIDELRIGLEGFRAIFDCEDELTLRGDHIIKIDTSTCWYGFLSITDINTWLRGYFDEISWFIKLENTHSNKIAHIKPFGFPNKFARRYHQGFLSKYSIFPDLDETDEVLRAYGYADPEAYRKAYRESL